MNAARLEGKVAIVTGAGQGIGEGIATLFSAEGARVVVATRTEKNGSETVDAIRRAGGEATLQIIDVGEAGSGESIVNTALDTYGRVDIMVHNAASFLMDAIVDYSEEDLETSLSVNLKACFRLSAACIPHFKNRKGVVCFSLLRLQVLGWLIRV